MIMMTMRGIRWWLGIALVGIGVVSGCRDKRSSDADSARPILVFNEDDSHFFGRPADKMTEAGLLEYLDEVTASGAVTHFFMCPNAMRANFDSKAFEPIWTAMSEPGRKPGWGPRVKLLHDRGIDPYAVWAKGCRVRGVSPWLTMRMNDVHSVHDPSFCSHSTFWQTHPEFRRIPGATVKNGGQWTDWALDYSHPEVRAYSLGFVRELLERYDVDGIECDWMRFPAHLPPGREAEFAGCLNAFMREVRRAADAAAQRLGHPVLVGVRVESDPQAALRRGTDVFAWAREGAVDWVVPCNFFTTVDFELPYADWRRRMDEASPKVRVIPGADSGVLVSAPERRWKRRLLTFEEYCGWADRMYSQGAEGVYLFNLFQHPATGTVWKTVLTRGLGPEIVRAAPKSIPENARRECAWAFKLGSEVSHAIQAGDSRPLVGAIRWDAYQGIGDYNALVAKTLADADQRWRAPWFSVLNADGSMTVDGSKPGVMEREIDFASDAGLDYWAFVMYNPLPEVGLSRGIELYLKASNRSRMKFAIIAHCHFALTDADWPRERDRWIAYLQEPGYVRVLDGRPLVYVLNMSDARQSDFRARAKAAGLNPYFVQISSDWTVGKSRWTVPGGDACGRYAAVRNDGGSYADLVSDAEKLWRLPVERGLEVVPLVTTGWEKTGRKRYPPFWELKQFYHRQKEFPAFPQPMEIARHLQKAMRFVVAHPGSCRANTVLVYAWNEHDEGGWLCPTWTSSGVPDTSRLDAVCKVLRGGNMRSQTSEAPVSQ